MKPIDDATVRDAIRKRMSPPNQESVAQIARDTGITTQTLYNWRLQWQKQGQLVPATTKPPEQWPPADKRQAGRRDPVRRPQRHGAGCLLPGAGPLSQTVCPLAAGRRGCQWLQRCEHG